MLRGSLPGDGRQRLLAGDAGVTGQQARELVREHLRRLPDAGVGHLRQVELLLPALLIDHEQGGGVVDLSPLNLDGDAVSAPGGLQLRQRPGEEVPLVNQAMCPRVGEHVRDAGGHGVRVHAKQLHLVARGAEQLLRFHHALRGQRADGGALGILERQDDDLTPELAQRHRLAELVDQPEIRRRPRAEGGTGVQVGIVHRGRA